MKGSRPKRPTHKPSTTTTLGKFATHKAVAAFVASALASNKKNAVTQGMPSRSAIVNVKKPAIIKTNVTSLRNNILNRNKNSRFHKRFINPLPK